MRYQVLVEQFLEEGVAFLPHNEVGVGEGVRALLEDGRQEFWRVGVTGMLKALARYHAVDIKALRQRYGQMIGRAQMVPLPIAGDCLLIPFKARIPIGRQPSAGWVLVQHIRDIEELPGGCSLLRLSGGHRVKVWHSRKFCENQLRYADLVQYRYFQLHRWASPSWVLEDRGRYR